MLGVTLGTRIVCGDAFNFRLYLRRYKMYLSSLESAEKKKLDIEGAQGVYKQIPISKAAGTPTFSFRVFTIEPGDMHLIIPTPSNI